MKNEITVTPAGDTLIVREGKAMELREPVVPKFKGNIDAVSIWLETRTHDQGVAEFDIPGDIIGGVAATISYTDAVSNYYGAIITGVLRLDPVFEALGIGSMQEMSKKEFVLFLKKRRFLFPDKAGFADLLKKIEQLQLKVSQSITDKTVDRGNKENSFGQKVTSDLPEYINVTVPIFKGQEPKTFRLELPFDVNNGMISFWLESADAVELLDYERTVILDKERARIAEQIKTIIYK